MKDTDRSDVNVGENPPPPRIMSTSLHPGILVACGIAVLIFFNVEFNIYAQEWRFLFRLPVELTVCFGLIAAGRALPFLERMSTIVAKLILSIGAVIHLIDVASRAIYGRAIDLVFDAAQIPHVLDLLAASMGWFLVAPICLAVLGILATSGWLVARSSGVLSACVDYFVGFGRPRIVFALSLLLVTAQIADLSGILTQKAYASSAPAVKAASYHAKIVSLWLDDGKSVVEDYRKMRGEIRDGITTLPRLKDVNVYLVFVESYGASLLERDAHRTVIESIYAEYDARFSTDGRKSVSTLLESPTYGGLSWLAHLTTTAGAWIDTNLEYRAYIRSGMDTLQTILGRTGHETALFMPGIKRYWPEGQLLKFDYLMTAQDFDYQGISFGYFGIPDQFTLERIPTLQPEQTPRFVQVALISSHYPFRPLPPFIEDRTRILDPTVWKPAADAAGSFDVEDWADPADGYIAGVQYSLRAALDFTARHTTPEDLVIVMGDHQPWSVVSGNLGGRAAPIHIFSGRQDLLDCFRSDGFRTGIYPKRGDVLFGMDWMLQRLVAHFGDQGPDEGCARPLSS